MDMISNEILYYGGLIVVAFTIISAIVYAYISTIRMMYLKKRLIDEYGEKQNHNTSTK